ncbi:MAG: adenylate kinase [Candidatus Omnitrophica bacterium]|nr:adenylate kinase [Candidatus Omnitrophota bacterium]
MGSLGLDVKVGLMRLVFLGAPGAGKGTVASLLEERLGISHLSSGDLLREALRKGDSLGTEASRYMKAGVLVPDDLICGLILNRIERLGNNCSFVLDGFPRTKEQAEAIDSLFRQKGHKPVDLAVDFQIAPAVVVERLAGRRVCETCRINYHVTRIPPRRPGVCDRCGSSLITRPDDRPETIRKRLEVYEAETGPLLDFYRSQGKLRTIPGDQEVEEEYGALMGLLKEEGLADAVS